MESITWDPLPLELSETFCAMLLQTFVQKSVQMNCSPFGDLKLAPTYSTRIQYFVSIGDQDVSLGEFSCTASKTF